MAAEMILCDEETRSVSVYVTAELEDNKLTISGIDGGKATEVFWGGDDYEYWYYFDEKNTALLFQKIGAQESDPLITLKEKFNGMDACRNLREYCDSAGIEYRFDSWT